MKAGAELLQAIFSVTFTTQKLLAMKKSLIQFLTTNNSHKIPDTALNKKDPFLENLRPLFTSIYKNVKN